MNIPKIANAMGYVDDGLVTGAIEYTGTKRKTFWLKWAAIAACICVVVCGITVWNKAQIQNSANTLYGADKIYPTIMVQGRLYEWRKGAAICNSLPDDCIYYGEIVHIEEEKPNDDGEFASVFSVSGQIYTVPQNNSVIYLRLTTNWLDNTVVAFDYIDSKE